MPTPCEAYVEEDDLRRGDGGCRSVRSLFSCRRRLRSGMRGDRPPYAVLFDWLACLRLRTRRSFHLLEAYTGTVESTLRHPGGERIYSCSFLAGVRQRCDWLGQEPPGGTLVYHTCDSYYIPIMYGGVGSYACSLH